MATDDDGDIAMALAMMRIEYHPRSAWCSYKKHGASFA